MSLFNELKRRNVIRVALAYLVLGWLVLQVADVLVDALELPVVWSKAVIALLVVGFIPAVVFSWVYEMTPEGIKRESEVTRDESITHVTSQKLNIAIVLLLVLAIALFALDRFTGAPEVYTQPVMQAVDAAPARQGDTKVVAVLPLQAFSTEDEGKFLASGLHDDLLTRLARLDAFRVISRTSVMEYANTTKNLREIGRELGAGFIVEGGLQAIGGRVRINAQLIDAQTDEHLWAQTYDRELTTANLFDVQADIATAIADALHTALSPREVKLLDEVPTESLAAYQAYLRGRGLDGDLSQPGMEASMAAFREAVELDPEFADAWGGLSKSLSRKYWETGGETGSSPDPLLREEAKMALDRAKALDPDSIAAMAAEAYYFYYGYRDYSSALIALGRALGLAPNDDHLTRTQAFLLRRLGRLSEASDALRMATLAAPNDPYLVRESINTLVAAGRCAEASAQTTAALTRFPERVGMMIAGAFAKLICDNDPAAAADLAERIDITTIYDVMYTMDLLILTGKFELAIERLTSLPGSLREPPFNRQAIDNYLGWLYRRGGQEDRALEAIQSAGAAFAEIEQPGTAQLASAALTFALLGDVERTLELGQRALDAMPEDAWLEANFRYWVLRAYALAGAEEEALAQFEKMWNAVGGHYITVPGTDPFLEPLRQHPGLEEFMAKPGLTD